MEQRKTTPAIIAWITCHHNFAGMNKIYHLGNCSTCQDIIRETNIGKKDFEFHEIKTGPISSSQLDHLAKMAGSFERLFSRRALKYKALGLKNKTLTEKDYRRYILEEYTFLKRPVVVIGNKIFIGSEKKNVAALKDAVAALR